jgi:uncharacterized protein YdaU (DUF1376 family)
MSDLPYRPEHVNDAIAETEELSNEELGAYVRLQRALWRSGGYLPANQLSRFARAGKRWGKIAPAILAKLTIVDGWASCSVLLDLLLRTRERRAAAVDKARMAGRASGQKRASAVTFGGMQKSRLNGDNPLESHKPAELQVHLENTNQNHKIDSKSGRGIDVTGAEREIFDHGAAVLVERVKLRRTAATSQISKWLAELGDAHAVADLIAAGVHENLTGAPFVAVIDQRVKTLKTEREKGLPLPFGFQPNVVRK